jgi:hypothetical protein
MAGDVTNTEHNAAMDNALKKELTFTLTTLSGSLLFDFSSHDNLESPEQEGHHTVALQKMKICMTLDEFYDIVFNLDGNIYIKGNSFVLKDRSEYFRAMLNNGFKESSEKKYQ